MKMTQCKKQSLYVWRFGATRIDDKCDTITHQTVIARTEHEARSSLDDYICYFAGKRPASPAEISTYQ
ncbi:host cell division inhibitor Icd-like protein [Tatumella sp. OPLPL6]|uniref:host cell division inhibitor Icd-like protein n=1 Tax=Tatumella sp. OPLPL6 TaxID=1928657 RepID=UPI000C1871C9|nr:host cell division inhibitor Icd-like protein [Tatumella sp. OPLPL6]PIJ43277.1 hypothetical protein BOM24_08895 [Tatumella sp. OPLPL6]